MRSFILNVAVFCALAALLFFAPAGPSLAEEAGKPETPPASATPPSAEQTDPDQEPARFWDYRPEFETDGKGGLYFEDSLRTQREYPGVTDHVIQGGLEPNFFFIVHYPQGWGEKADAEIKRFVRNLAGEHIFAYHDDDTTQAEFFSKSYAKPDAVAAHERALEETLRKDPLAREKYELEDRRIFPIFVDYEVSESPRARSVNFRIWSYSGGAHDNWTYSAISLNKATGEAVTLDRLFSAPGSLKRAERWLNTTKDAGYYYRGSCTTGESALERTGINLNSDDIMMKKGLAMDRLIFTPEGLEVVFAPYEQGSFAMGDVRAPIPLKALRALGVNDRYWKDARDERKRP